MNRYAVLARDHWAKHRPHEYSQISDPQTFFAELGETMAAQIDELSHQLEGEDPPGDSFLEKMGRLNMARLQAEEQVLRQTLPISEADAAHDQPA